MTGGVSWRQRHGEPKNRRQQFLCVLHDQYFSMLGINLLCAVFYVPAVVWTAGSALRISRALAAGAQQEAVQLANSYFLLLWPCLLLGMLTRPGLAKLMRRWAQEESVPAYSTFFAGLRENLRQTLCVGIPACAVPLILWYAGLTAVYSKNSVMSGVILAAGLIFGVLLLSLQVLFPLLVTYELPLKNQLRNAVILTLLRLTQSLLVLLGRSFFLLMYLAFVCIRPNLVYALLIIPLGYYGFGGVTISSLAQAIYSQYLFERYLKTAKEPETPPDAR